jgi:uncharacterized protein YegJ (DUF2314 family)
MENRSNIYFTCPEHSSRPQEKFALMNPKKFLNKWIKKSFNEISTNKIEHLWIKIKSIKPNSNILVGVVDNDSFLNLDIKCGDTIEVQLTEIEDLLE